MGIKSLKPNRNSDYAQGYFKPKNPKKYKGDPNCIIYRSSWELRFMSWCDMHPNIKLWANEEVKIPFYNPCKRFNAKTWTFTAGWANYYIDFYIEVEKTKGDKKVAEGWFVEVKPGAQNGMDKKQFERLYEMKQKIDNMPNDKTGERKLKKLRSYNYQMKTLVVNKAKFEAAMKFAKDRGCRFSVADENFLF